MTVGGACDFSHTSDTGAESHIGLPCHLLPVGFGAQNVMTAHLEAHTAKSHYICCPPHPSFFPSPLSSVCSSCSWIPGLLSPSLVLSFLMSFHIQIALLAVFLCVFFLTKEQLRELALTGVHGNNPRQLTNPFNPHQVIPWTSLDPF